MKRTIWDALTRDERRAINKLKDQLKKGAKSK